MLDIMLGWLSFTRPANAIFPLTYSLAIFSFIIAFIRINTGLPVRLLLSASFPFAFVQTFETIYQKLGYALTPLAFAGTIQPQVLAVEASWLLLGFSTIPLWRWSRKGLASLLFLIAGFALWALVDYPSAPRLQPLGIGLALNIALKIDSALLFTALLYEGTRTQSRSRLRVDEKPREGIQSMNK